MNREIDNGKLEKVKSMLEAKFNILQAGGIKAGTVAKYTEAKDKILN